MQNAECRIIEWKFLTNVSYGMFFVGTGVPDCP